MEPYTIEALYDLNETIAAELFAGKTYPWEVLDELGAFVRKLGETLDPLEYDRADEDIWVAKSAKVSESASLCGPLIIGKNAEIRHCAFIRGNVLVGEGAVVGNSTELKNALLFNGVQVPHYNYVGDSVLGCRAHMGAGSVCSNVRADKRPVTVKDGKNCLKTGRKKFGAMLGDGAEIGCGAVLNPGTVIGRNSSVYPLSSVRGCVPADAIYKKDDTVIRRRADGIR